MKILEEDGWKIVLADESRDTRSVLWFLIIISGLVPLACDVHSSGMIPGTELYEIALRNGGSRDFRELVNHPSLWLAVVGVIVVVLYEFLHTYPVVVLDKARGKFILHHVRWRTRNASTIREVELEQVRCARIGNEGDLWRLEFELENGELLAPRRTYSSNYSRPTLFALVEKINKFLKVNQEMIKDIG
jgi:hypothetical protein